jgi:hypothetical protein
MIDIALKFLKDFLTQEIGSPETILGNITKDSDIENEKIHLSLVHVEEEKILKEVIHQRRLNPADNFYTTINPEIRVNLYVLVTYQYGGQNYEEALKQLGNVIRVLQGKYVFTKPDFMKVEYEPLQQIVVDLHTQTLEQNSNMWQSLGEKLSPSLLYKMRVVSIQDNRALNTTGEVKAIGIDLKHKQFES